MWKSRGTEHMGVCCMVTFKQEFTLGNIEQKSAPQFSIRSRNFLHMPLCLEPYGEQVCGGPSFQRIRKSGRAKSERFPVRHICLPAV